MDSKHLSAIDLFAGAGGFSLAAQDAGLDVRLAVEMDNHACQTYRNNFPKNKKGPILVMDDIRQVDWPKQLKDAGLKPSECSILLGGPPCQGFSTHRIKDAGVEDPRNSLLWAYFDCLSQIRPTAFLVENVPGLLWSRHSDYLTKFLEMAKRDYEVFDPIVVNARDYGVPQNRKRVFILGFRSDFNPGPINWPPAKSHYPPNSAEVLEKGMPAWVPASVVFQKALALGDGNAVHMNHCAELVEAFSKTPKNGGSRRDSGRVLDCHKDHDGHKDVYGRIKTEEPGPTMTTACINPSKGRFVHPTENHGITARHAARFQTFPDTFEFSGGLIAAGKQIGNAVPIKLGARILGEIRKALSYSKKRSNRKGQRGGQRVFGRGD